jgi:hypothetical protein
VSGVISAIGPGKPFAMRGPMNLLLWASFATALTTTAGSLNVTVASAGPLAVGDAVNSVNVPPGATLATFSGTAGTLALAPVTLQCDVDAPALEVKTPAAFNVNELLGATVTVQTNADQTVLPAGTAVAAIVQQNIPPAPGYAGQHGIIKLSAAPTQLPVNKGQVPLEFAPTTNAILVSGADAAASFTGAAVEFEGTVQVERSFDGGKTWIVCNIGGSGQLAQYTTGTPVSLTFGEPEKQVLYRLNCTAYTAQTGVSLNYRISQTGGAAESLTIGPLSGG